MEKSIYRYVLKYSLRDQVYLLVLTALSMPFIYISLDIPKRIINQAIGGEDIPETILGVEINQIDYLIILCSVFLLLVIVNGSMKYYLNVYRGILGERMLRRLRYELYTRILRFPLPHFKRISQGEIIPMITAETEPLGGFIGEAYALPAFQGGTLLTYLFFIFNQDPLLGAAATALYPFQLYVIPKLQRKVNLLAKQRVLAVRKFADRVGEGVAGITEIHAHDTSKYERADIGERLGGIYHIRYELYKRKFFIKFLNNFLAQVTPFFFYSVGGYYVIQGNLSIGALVAVLAAYKDLASPWAELLKYYQMKEDVRIKYEQIVEQFHPPKMLDQKLLDADFDHKQEIKGDLLAANLSYSEDDVVRSVDAASFRFPVSEHVALVGATGCGKDELCRLFARLLLPTGGRLSLADQNMAELPEAFLGSRMAYIGSGAYLFIGSVADNLFYGLKHAPNKAQEYDPEHEKVRSKALHDAELAGNSLHDIHADWIDYQAAGVQDWEELIQRALELFPLVEMEDDMYQLGLRSTLDPSSNPELTHKILRARALLREKLQETGTAAVVEPFDDLKYNNNATVAENLLFGTPRDSTLSLDELAYHPYVLGVLDKVGLRDDLVETGRQVAETMVDLFADLPPGHEFFEQFSFISAEDLPEFQALLGRIKTQGKSAISDEERSRMLSLAFLLIPARHRLGLIDEKLKGRLLEARRVFAEDLPDEMQNVIEFFSAERYNAASTLQDNILFGKRVYGQAHGLSRLAKMLEETVAKLSLRNDILRVGLEYEVGIAGGRLSPTLRQKIGIVRCLLKQPDVLVINEATEILDSNVEARVVERIRAHMQGRGLIWVVGKIRLTKDFDRILMMDDGKLVEQGRFQELDRTGTNFQKLLRTQ